MESDSLPGFTRLFSKLFSSKSNVTEKDILLLVEEGSESGVIEEQAHKMINKVLEFRDLTAGDIMTHRTDVTAVCSAASVSEVVKASIGTGFSRLPVYEESVDRIIGIICVKDLLCLIGSAQADETDIKTFIRKTIYLPKTLSCRQVFTRLTLNKMQMAVIIDEYGGTAGLVTMEDVVEAIVGNIQDEFDAEEEEALIRESDGVFIIDGAASPDDILHQLGIILPEDNDFETMSGFVIDLLGRIPEENETPEAEREGVKFKVLSTGDMRIAKIKATLPRNSLQEI
ncbi:MAG: hemolysin family protein [Oscillospiraceae bacterium]|nr:hemolysin family protein [Oscillospiraceae bacterium]